MGELLICCQSIASMPYYMEGVGINIYSMEELCYFMMHNTYLLDSSFMSEELCVWVEKQMKSYKLAERMRDCIHSQGKLSDFVLIILDGTYYCSMQEIQQIVFTVRQMEEKSSLECNKLRADQLMEKDKFLAAIYEYKRLLESEDAKEAGEQLCGNIWHNLGTAYARLFLFEQARHCYEQAFILNKNKESLKSFLVCYRCLHDESGFMKAAYENHLQDDEINEIEKELSAVSNDEKVRVFEEQLEELANQMTGAEKEKAKAEINSMILDWKEEYRKNCRV